MPYACTAKRKGRGRCRNKAIPEEKDWFCKTHVARRDSGKIVEKEGIADTTLLMIKLNQNWERKMLDLGIPKKDRDVSAEDAKHEAHAKAFGRDPFSVLDGIPSSGVAIFGKKGLEDISIFEAFKDLVAVYKTVDIHIRPQRKSEEKKWMSVLVISFSNEEKDDQNPDVYQEILEFLASPCWGYVHIFANPPQEDGRIVHAINVSHRKPDAKPKFVLRLSRGLWATKDPV
jgi:hypothetical protein